GVDNKDNLTNQNAFIRTTGGTTLNVGGDATLAGANIDAGGGVSGEIKGNLVVETRTDRKLEENTNVSIYAGLGTVNTDKGGSTKGMSTGEKIDYYQDRGVDRANQLATTGVFIDASSNKTDSVTIGQQSGISGGQGGVSGLVVGGNATLKGATEETQNVTVRGTTTVSNVETHHKESSVDFELRGTVASALGSDEGKAGQVSGKLFKASGSAKLANDSSTWQSAQPSNKSGARDADQGGVSIGSHRTSADTGGVSIGSHRASAAADPGGARPQQDGPTLTARKPDTDAPKRPRPDTDNVTGATKPASGYGAMPPVTAPERKPVTDTAARPDTTVVARQPAADAAPGARPDADASATPPAHYNSLVSGTTQVRKPGGTDTGAVPPRPDTSVATAPSAPVRQPGADMAPGT
ncbi:MAG: hemagglutinin repeat-containing protein, partial [Burkholderiales bacterium]|nr:hemagglutinin repeat-containing protein [Burkholderiales bacterium]